MFVSRTEIPVKKAEKQISHKNKLIFIGSCFSENIGSMVKADKFPSLINPFGVQYNPVSVLNELKSINKKKVFCKSDLVKNGNLWCSFFHHSIFSSVNQELALKKINRQVEIAARHFREASHLFITFGTARVYRYNKTGEIVSNCHKFHANEFSRELLTVEEIVSIYSEFILEIASKKPELQIVFTLSPVRHIKDGFAGNMQSKSILHLAIQELVKKFENCNYFPAYEIFMDDLRDYRYYADDMIHPGSNGIKYLYDKFSEVFFAEESKRIIFEIRKIKQSLAHRNLSDDYDTFSKFNFLQIEKAKLMQEKYGIDFSEEIGIENS